jgi:hypothetical protein
MALQIVRKPPIGKSSSERLKVTLSGNHTLEDKLAMSMEVIHRLRNDGFTNAGTMDLYIPLIGPDGRELTMFANGDLIADFHIIVDCPYRCAADEYDRPAAPPCPRPF